MKFILSICLLLFTLSANALDVLGDLNVSGSADIAGTLQTNTADSSSTYSFPSDRGTDGQILMTDGVGSTSWIDNILIVDALTSTSTIAGLSANQGKILDEKIDAGVSGKVTGPLSSIDNHVAIFNGAAGDTLKLSFIFHDNSSLETSLVGSTGNTPLLTIENSDNSKEAALGYDHLSLASAGSVNTFSLLTPNLSSTYSLTVPVDPPTDGQFLQADATGQLSFVDLPATVIVEDNLTSSSSVNALSANQGRILDGKITPLTTASHAHTNKTLLDTLTSAGSATQFLSADGTYKTVLAGDVVGPGTSVTGNLAFFSDDTGKLLADSGIATSTVGNIKGATATYKAYQIATFKDTTGKLISNGGGGTYIPQIFGSSLELSGSGTIIQGYQGGTYFGIGMPILRAMHSNGKNVSLYFSSTAPSFGYNITLPADGPSSGQILQANSTAGQLSWINTPVATTVIDNLTSTNWAYALSANQGRVLNEKILAIPASSSPTIVEDVLNSTSTVNALSANQGRVLDTTKGNVFGPILTPALIPVRFSPILTSPTSASGYVLYNSTGTSNSSHNVFDGEPGTDFYTNTGGPPLWITLQIPAPKSMIHYIVHLPTGDASKSWTLSGSNDNTNWTVIDAQVGALPPGPNIYVLPTPTPLYSYFKIDGLSDGYGVGDIYEFEFYEEAMSTPTTVNKLAIFEDDTGRTLKAVDNNFITGPIYTDAGVVPVFSDSTGKKLDTSSLRTAVNSLMIGDATSNADLTMTGPLAATQYQATTRVADSYSQFALSDGQIGDRATLYISGTETRLSLTGFSFPAVVAFNNYTSGQHRSVKLAGPQNPVVGLNYTIKLPATAPAANQVMRSDASGNLSWVPYTSPALDAEVASLKLDIENLKKEIEELRGLIKK